MVPDRPQRQTRLDLQELCQDRRLKRVAFEWIQATRFKFSFLCMSLSQNRCALLRDMH
jgi:hypothetical protein